MPTKTLRSCELTEAEITQIAHQAVELAAQLLTEAQATQTRAEKRQAAKLGRLLTDPTGKQFTIAMSDRAFRSKRPRNIADQINHLIDQYGIPRYMEKWEQAALKLGAIASRYLPSITIPQIAAQIRRETESIILPGESKPLTDYIQKRTVTDTRLNLNQLGEAILGEAEAQRRLDAYLALLQRPDVDYISVKISSIFSQINMAAVDWSAEQIKNRLRTLYMTAHAQNKFVNLDMEEYRDLHLTVRVFQELLDEPAFHDYRAGIVLQAYLPDSFAVQKHLTQWATERVESGRAPIKIRIVKGANLAMEQVEASLHGWEQTPYHTKAQVDANYKRMIIYGMAHADAVNLGIASHNLFDIAFALILREHLLSELEAEKVEFEMLEGMANHQARAIQKRADGLLLYAPVVKRQDFDSAIAYLVRRLDENTADGNFLRDLFHLQIGDDAWQKQAGRFLTAVAQRNYVPTTPNRQQNRLTETITFAPNSPFTNTADTDFSLPANQIWVENIVETWQQHTIPPIPIMINGVRHVTDRIAAGHDPARPTETAYTYHLATADDVAFALDSAHSAQSAWASTSISYRKNLLIRCAETVAAHRGDLIGVMMRDGAKTIQQADNEVSEAIDFANYYGRAFDQPDIDPAAFTPLGTILITPPWNFPLAIPAGGIFASLMAGNVVIIKPAPEAVLTAWELCQCLWDAGVPHHALHFVPTSDDDVGRSLVTSPLIDGVILTGSYETARLFQIWKPHLNLMAETSGKNSLIITAQSDRDQAIKDLVYSAFGHNGQKCSAASLAILEAELYDDPNFRRQLVDAVSSLPEGTQWHLESGITPLTQPPSPTLQRGLTQLDDGESWLLKPRQLAPNHYTPGIRLGVQPGSFYHRNECFGPILGLVRADDLDHAIQIGNDSDFGLTSGIHTLDPREIEQWREQIEAGNIYVNRPTTGAIVQRQPFGGWKKSAFGSGAKAGGPNYVFSLGRWRDSEHKADVELSPAVINFLNAVKSANTSTLYPSPTEIAKNYAHAWNTHYALDHDPSQLLGESNIFRYRPHPNLLAHFSVIDDLQPILRIILATLTCGVDLNISIHSNNRHRPLLEQISPYPIVIESEPTIDGYELGRLRTLQPLSEAQRERANRLHIAVTSGLPLSNGRLELRHYLREQSVSETTHRHGNILA